MLRNQNIQTARPSKKLEDRYLGPFQIIDIHGKQAYTLRLPPQYRSIHPTFHISLLEEYSGQPQDEKPGPIEVDDHEEWHVEGILDKRTSRNKTKYSVKWTGWPIEEATWEPPEHLDNLQDMLLNFNREHEQRQDTKAQRKSKRVHRTS